MNSNEFTHMEQTWKDGFSNESPENLQRLCDSLIGSRRQNSLDSLADRYRRFMMLGFGMTLVSITFIFGHIFPRPFNYWIGITMWAYFLTGALMDTYLFRGIRSINIYKEGVAEVARQTRHYRRRHLQFMAILIPWMLLILVLMCCAFLPNEYMLWGIAFGFIVGLAIGLRQFFKFMEEYKELSAED